MELDGPFRGSAAVAAGALSRDVLTGARYRRLFRDIYVPAALPVDLALRSRAAALLVGPDGALAGFSAAELLGASCGPASAPAEVSCPRPRRSVPGLLVHRGRLDPDEIVLRAGTRLTTPARTAYDLARRLDLREAVAAVDTLAHRCSVALDELRELRSRHLGTPGNRRVEPVLRLVDPRSESPMESRIRVPLVLAGMPPEVQFPVLAGGRRFRLDLAYPTVRLGVEYDGGHHRTAEQARRDLEREAMLAAVGWKIIRFDARIVLTRPQLIVADTRIELARRGR